MTTATALVLLEAAATALERVTLRLEGAVSAEVALCLAEGAEALTALRAELLKAAR